MLTLRFVCLRLGAVIACVAALLGATPVQASEEFDEAVLLELVNGELDGTGWTAEFLRFTDDRMEQQQGDQRLLVRGMVVTVRAQRPLYRRTETVDDVVFAEVSVAVGDRFELTGDAALFTGPGERAKDMRFSNLDDMAFLGRSWEGTLLHYRELLIEGTEEAIAARAAIDAARAEAEAAARAEAERQNALYEGDWISLSRCGAMDFEHHITLNPTDTMGHFTGQVRYRPIYPAPPFSEGSYMVAARIDPRRDRLVVDHERWIDQPRGTRMVNITLTLEETGNDAPVTLTGTSGAIIGGMIQGVLGGVPRGNCSYRLQRPDDFAAEREATLAPVRALLERMEKGVWIDGSQTGPERDGRTDWPVRVQVTEITEEYILATAELRAFHANSRRVLGDVEWPFALFLTRGIEEAEVQWGIRQRPRGGDMRNLYTRSNFCTDLGLVLNSETGVISGSNNDRQGCIDELRLPLVP